jgi:hypothetical protein
MRAITTPNAIVRIVEGGCSCGAVRYRLTSEPMIVHCCHCLNCQRQTGSAFVINALIELDRLEVEGETEPADMAREGDAVQTIHRCPACKIAVYSFYGWPELAFVRAGTLDDPSVIEPDVHIYTRSKVPWVTLPDGVPAFDAFYPNADFYPPASRERFGALRARREATAS